MNIVFSHRPILFLRLSKSYFIYELNVYIYFIVFIVYSLPGTSLPNIGLIPHLIQDAFVISIISFSISVSISKVAAKDLGYTINSNQVC